MTVCTAHGIAGTARSHQVRSGLLARASTSESMSVCCTTTANIHANSACQHQVLGSSFTSPHSSLYVTVSGSLHE